MVYMTKSQIRKSILERRKNMAEEELATQSKKIALMLEESNYYKDCSIIFTYVSFPPEVDTIAIIEKAWSDNKTVYVPKVKGKELIFYKIYDFKSLSRSKFGILEPLEGVHIAYGPNTNPDELKLMLIPGLAFDPSGNRIGYGAGYYDRFLTEHKEQKFVKMALSYDFQIQKQLEAEEHDIKVDYIISPDKIYECRRRKGYDTN